MIREEIRCDAAVKAAPRAKRYTSRSTHRNEILHGCAFTGASIVSLSISGLATVMHAPRSCAHYSIQIPANTVRRTHLDGSEPIKAFASPEISCSDMDDADMIFGSIDSLESCVRETIEKGNDTLAVITSCPSGIIGEDIEGMMDRIRKDHPNVTIIPMIQDGNVNGDFMQGIIDASLGLMRSLSVKGEKERSVNIVGIKTLATNTTRNMEFVSNVLQRLGVKVNCKCIGDTSVKEIRNIPNAEMSILISPDRFALMVRDFMKDNFNLEFTKNVIRPGMKETELWIREIGEHFGQSEKAEQVIKEFRNEFEERLIPLKEGLKERTAYIMGTHMDVSWIMETALGCGMNVQRCVVIDLLDHSEDYDLKIDHPVEFLTYDKIPEVVDDIKAKRPDIMITSYPVDVDPQTETCFIQLVPNVGPFTGPEFAGSWLRSLKAPKTEGWRKDVV
jgi:nitrogenase molybdenum-iron protein alpha/beta subunit